MTISISEHEAIERAMMPGDWKWSDASGDRREYSIITDDRACVVLFGDEQGVGCSKEDRIGIVAMRNAYPEMLAILREVKEWEQGGWRHGVPSERLQSLLAKVIL